MKKLNSLLLVVLLLSMSSLSLDAGEEEKASVKPYGYIKLDAIYETGNSYPGNYTLWAKDPGNSDGIFHVTARQTRLGLAMKGISFGNFKVTGKVEVDFHSSGVPENKSYNFMRHAFLTISNGSFTIIAGQTSDIISPLVPSSLNYPVLWCAGNIGYRRPQLSFRQDFKTGKNTFTIQGGITRTISDDYDGDGINDGIAAGFPTVQGRIGGKFALGPDSSLQLGFSGHYGKSKGTVEYTSNSINVDFLLMVSKIKIIAEYFSGKNLGTYLGGIAQSVNLNTNEEINAKGFYVNAVAAVSKKVQFSFGYGMDDPDDNNLNYSSGSSRTKNTSIFGNIVINLSPSLQIGLQVSNWQTDYLNREKQETLRFQHCWILSF
jgi:hypothetical protein